MRIFYESTRLFAENEMFFVGDFASSCPENPAFILQVELLFFWVLFVSASLFIDVRTVAGLAVFKSCCKQLIKDMRIFSIPCQGLEQAKRRYK